MFLSSQHVPGPSPQEGKHLRAEKNSQHIPVISAMGEEIENWPVTGQLGYTVPGQPGEHGKTVSCAYCVCYVLVVALQRFWRERNKERREGPLVAVGLGVSTLS